jgi:chromosome segregation ATPase
MRNLPGVTVCTVSRTLEEAPVMKNSPAAASGCDAWAEQIVASLHTERDGVREFLATQQTRLERAETTLENAITQLQRAVFDAATDRSDAAGGAEQEDYRQRYEMALDDLRELKAGNLLLQEQLAKARATASALAKESRSEQVNLDWETEKLRILAALESDLNENDSEQRAERLKIEDVLQTTERSLAQKNQEIAERDDEIRKLKQRLDEATKTGPLDQMAAAMEQTLQNDIVIQQERERLRQLEEQIQSRMCRAEIEISLERAKLAREHVEIEERLRSAGLDPLKSAAEPKAPQQPARGRWLSRLGLTEADREGGKRR